MHSTRLAAAAGTAPLEPRARRGTPAGRAMIASPPSWRPRAEAMQCRPGPARIAAGEHALCSGGCIALALAVATLSTSSMEH